jgi:hypothetical protein
LTYAEDKSERKIEEISALMHSKGYFTYADTYINTIFVDKLEIIPFIDASMAAIDGISISLNVQASK